jgi:hypothetical protein
MLLLPNGQTAGAWAFAKKQSAFSEIGGHWIDMYLIFGKTKKYDGF